MAGRPLGSRDKISQKYKHCFSRQFLADHEIRMYRGDDPILTPLPKEIPRLYKIQLPNTCYIIGDQFVDQKETNTFKSYEMLRELGFVIISRRVRGNEKWSYGQAVVYELKKNVEGLDHLNGMPGGKFPCYVEHDEYNKAVRLHGERTGPMGVGPWVKIEHDPSYYDHGGRTEVSYKGYGIDSEEKVEEQMRDWLGIEGEPEPVFIKEAAFMITDANEIVCFPNLPDMPSILITGLKGCMVEGTLIDIPRDMKKYPDGVPIEELQDKTNFYVYSVNATSQEIEVKNAGSCEFSGEKEVYEVELTSGQKVQATGEHPFLQMDGSFKQLKDLVWSETYNHLKYWDKEKKTLVKTDRLRMWTRTPQTQNENMIKVELAPIKCKGNPDYHRQYYNQSRIEHRFIAEQIGLNIQNNVVHHINGNHFDNRPENLSIMTHKEHFDEHGMNKYAFEKGNAICEAGGYSTRKKPKLTQSEINRKLKQNYWTDPKYEESIAKWKETKQSLKKYRSGWRGGVIKSIKNIGVRRTFDIYDVQDNRNYIANGFCVSNTGKSYCLHSLVDRFFWKPAFDYKIAILNDSSRETGTWCMPNTDYEQILTLRRLNERPLPLPTVYLHPKVKEDYETLYMGSTGFFITIPFKEIVENHKVYLKIEGSVRYFSKFKEQLKNCATEKEAQALFDTLKASPLGIPFNTMNKIEAEFETLFDTKMTDISSEKQHPWSVSSAPDKYYNPLTACVHAGVLPILETEYVSNQRSMLNIYFTYFVSDLFMRQKQDPDFVKTQSSLLLVLDEAHNISQKGIKSGADMLLRRCVREGRPRRIGTIIATQKFNELPDVIKDNSTYLVCFKNPGEAAQIANQYKMGKAAVHKITDLGKHECLVYSTDYFIVYDQNGNRRKTKPNEILKGRCLPTLSQHKAPKAKGRV